MSWLAVLLAAAVAAAPAKHPVARHGRLAKKAPVHRGVKAVRPAPIPTAPGGGPAPAPASAGGEAQLQVTLPAGTYRLYCSLPDHEQLGMWTTLVIR